MLYWREPIYQNLACVSDGNLDFHIESIIIGLILKKLAKYRHTWLLIRPINHQQADTIWKKQCWGAGAGTGARDGAGAGARDGARDGAKVLSIEVDAMEAHNFFLGVAIAEAPGSSSLTWAQIAGRRNSESLRVKPRQLYSECWGWNPEWLGVSASVLYTCVFERLIKRFVKVQFFYYHI
jgi:hypothetical protein